MLSSLCRVTQNLTLGVMVNVNIVINMYDVLTQGVSVYCEPEIRPDLLVAILRFLRAPRLALGRMFGDNELIDFYLYLQTGF